MSFFYEENDQAILCYARSYIEPKLLRFKLVYVAVNVLTRFATLFEILKLTDQGKHSLMLPSFMTHLVTHYFIFSIASPLLLIQFGRCMRF